MKPVNCKSVLYLTIALLMAIGMLVPLGRAYAGNPGQQLEIKTNITSWVVLNGTNQNGKPAHWEGYTANGDLWLSHYWWVGKVTITSSLDIFGVLFTPAYCSVNVPKNQPSGDWVMKQCYR